MLWIGLYQAICTLPLPLRTLVRSRVAISRTRSDRLRSTNLASASKRIRTAPLQRTNCVKTAPLVLDTGFSFAVVGAAVSPVRS